MRVVIAGAGIGGLVTALSLHKAGITDVTVYERVREMRPLGVGINLLPHAVRELTELGLGDRVAALGVPTATLSYYNRHGQLIWSEPRGRAAGYDWPQFSVHRGEFQLMLLQAVRERLGADSVVMGHGLIAVDERDGRQFAVIAANRGSGAEGSRLEVEAGVIVGADGIRSALRAQRYPDEGAPPWSGLILWRGTAITRPFLDGRTMIMAGDGEQKFVAYPLPCDEPGMARVNFIAERKARPGEREDADWNHPVDPSPIAELFRDWRFDWLDVPGVIARAEALLEYPMVDRDPLPRWAFGGSTLLGDAAHALYPNGSNGTSQAILDARTLAYELATRASGGAVSGGAAGVPGGVTGALGAASGVPGLVAGVPDAVSSALTAYEERRRPVTTALSVATRQTGPERVMLIAYDRAPQGFAHINDVIPQAELEQIAADYKKAAGFDPAGLNARPSLDPPTCTEEAVVVDSTVGIDPSTRDRAATTVQLRRYRFAPGDLQRFVPWWREHLVAVRCAAGFGIEFACAIHESDEFVWAVSVPGDAAAFERVAAAYMASEARAAVFALHPPVALEMTLQLVDGLTP